MDSLLYTRLMTSDLISGVNVNPTTPEPNSGLATLFYLLIGGERITNLDGVMSLRKCTYAVDVYSTDPTEVTALLDAVEEVTLSWRDEHVQGVFRGNRVIVPEQDIGSYHGQVVLDCWWNGTVPDEEESSSS